jgi:phosphate transport system substrate-binding protein
MRIVRLALGVLNVFLASAAGAAEVRVVGSDLLGPEASPALYEFSSRTGLPLALAFDGSRPGLDRLAEGRADLALLALPATERERLGGFETVPLAYHTVVFLVPAIVPLEEISLAQLRDIFGESGSGNVNRWSDLGLTGEIAFSAIAPQLPAEGQGIAAEFFRAEVLEGRPFKSNVTRYASRAELAQRLAGNRAALVLASARPAALSDVRQLRIAARPGEPAFSPTPENVRSADYPLALPLQIVFRREAAPRLHPLLVYLLSNEFSAVLARAELTTVSPAARAQFVQALPKN